MLENLSASVKFKVVSRLAVSVLLEISVIEERSTGIFPYEYRNDIYQTATISIISTVSKKLGCLKFVNCPHETSLMERDQQPVLLKRL